MSDYTKNTIKEWEDLSKPRATARHNYHGGPATGPGILAKYHQYYDKATQDIKRPRVLVLGATPELRDYALKNGAQVTVLDQSTEAIEKMTSLMDSDTANEITIAGNWLDMSLDDAQFDFVWGDAISNNVYYKEHKKLFSEIKRVL
ncbi:class I SAM-dependent methyltransferase [Patescibacteria group bacterium]|nr:class I SAM-dependent methyltransferase [Patescibacteria group bacterium]